MSWLSDCGDFFTHALTQIHHAPPNGFAGDCDTVANACTQVSAAALAAGNTSLATDAAVGAAVLHALASAVRSYVPPPAL